MNNIRKKLHNEVSPIQNEPLTTTRIQLKGYGASQYQARIITQPLTPFGVSKRSYTYAVTDVISSTRQILENPRIHLKTRHQLEAILTSLLNRLDNVVNVPFIQGTDPQLSKVSKQLFKNMMKGNETKN
ncbi:hypothetical protein [Crocosphaera chwakensis]|uniref:Uncharacterized protein n=1 Tax=Crocosphaera chwakensis CCY0110 TaxID=391612 RepID=A3IZV8_9CHRO|nr:hypothetical protein [Crocosphaera chwakensis]EAZ87985.1 hypothetical protein CY0110_31535 [Crocosphaera chwakensis CCY0110]